MYTAPAARSLPQTLDDARDTVVPTYRLVASGMSWPAVLAQFAARRWQRFGRATLLHNGPPTVAEQRRLVLLNAGPTAALAAFTAAEDSGLRGWERDTVHVLVPGGTHVRRLPGIPTRVHYAAEWDDEAVWTSRQRQRIAPAVTLAASTFARPRPAIGILAAAVQQRLARPADLRDAIENAPRLRHRHALLLAVADIEMGAEALSEIDFARLCRRHGLPAPERQVVRPDRFGRRRYLDAEWITRTGRRLVAELDGALHLIATTWWADQIRQNEVVLTDRIVLRFPTVYYRHEQEVTVDQLRRGLAL